jgi:Ca2+-binding EF-hand superfamily protein
LNNRSIGALGGGYAASSNSSTAGGPLQRFAPNSRSSPRMGGQQVPLGKVKSGKQKEDDLQSVTKAVQSAVRSAAASGQIWEEPGECKVSPAAIDRAEAQLKGAFERSKDFARYANNPIQGVQMLFSKLDKNHSGKVDAKEIKNLGKVLEFQMDDKVLSGLFQRYDIDHSGYITVEEFSRAMFKLDGDTEYKAKSAIARMREVLSLRAGGFESLKAIGSQFRIIDRDHNQQLSKDEYGIALDILFSAYNVKFSQAEKNALFTLFDHDKSGQINYDEFVRGIRGDMNDFRLTWVKQAFSMLDSDGSGVVDTSEMSRTYDVSQNPAVQTGKITPEEAMRQFMKHYDENMDGRITTDEFVENYQWVSSSIDSDDYFELMMRNAWHITGGEGWCANTSNLRVLVKHGNGMDEVVEVTHDLGLPHDPAKKYAEVIRRLTAQGVKDIKKIEFYG